ncbi:hypothetical protein [Pedobacter aquatilis]|uniref:hypothetical protein n=1 Tax=Pedobacter aquatilis TaxID=351343 RepID=UPI00292CAFBB|nr:hypothetical protein [Pedobacter aquatilis]
MLSGALQAIDGQNTVPKHIIRAFHFSGGKGFALSYNLKQATLTLNPPENLVRDALEMSQDELYNLFQRRTKSIMQLLMDQIAFCRKGNSYRYEIL